jgi:hypothetical protein
MPIFASCLLVLRLFGIVWLAIAWRFHLPFLSHPAGEPKVPAPTAAARQLHSRTFMLLSVVLATWIIRSKTSPSKRKKKSFPCLQTQAGRCRIRRRQQHTHAWTTLFSCDGEASCMAGVFISLQRLKIGCWDALSSRFVRWTKPLRTSLPLSTLADHGRSKSELVAENALLRQQLIILRRQVKRPSISRADRILLVLLARLVRTWQQTLVIVQPDTLLRWHRELFRLYWKRRSKISSHKPKVAAETIALIRR